RPESQPPARPPRTRPGPCRRSVPWERPPPYPPTAVRAHVRRPECRATCPPPTGTTVAAPRLQLQHHPHRWFRGLRCRDRLGELRSLRPSGQHHSQQPRRTHEGVQVIDALDPANPVPTVT